MNRLGKLLYEIRYLCGKRKYPFPAVINRVRTSELLANNSNLSIARFGDGEFSLVLSHTDIGFQEYNSRLAQRLQEILSSQNDSRILICIPDLFDDLNDLKPAPRSYWRKWIVCNRKALNNYVTHDRQYGDALVTRLYLPWNHTSNEMTIVNNLKKTWHNKAVLIVEGEKTRWGVGNDLLSEAKSVCRIICPSENAFTKYDCILDCCIKHADNIDVFILALGPTATVLAYDLAKNGYRALDLGHFDLQYEHMIRNATQRISIAGKYNNELSESYVDSTADSEYLNSIVDNLCDE